MSEANVDDEITDGDEPLVRLPRGKRLLFAAILYVIFLSDVIVRYGVNAILPLIQEDLEISATQVGFLSSAVFLGMAIFVMPISFVGENKSQRRAISFCSILWSGATVFCGMANSALHLIINRFFVGAGNSAYAPLSTAMMTSWYKNASWGKVLGIYNTAMVVGGALGFMVFASLADQYGWHMAFYIIGGMSLAASLLSLILPDNRKLMAAQGAKRSKKACKDADEISQIKLNARETVKLVIDNKALLFMCLAAGLAIFSVNICSTFISIFYVSVKEMSVTTAAKIIALGTPFSMVAYPVGGAILDRWYKKDPRAHVWMPMLSVFATGVVCGVGYGFSCVPLIVVGTAIYSIGNTSFHIVSQELVPVWYKSVSYGVYVLFIQFFGAMGPIIGGVLVDIFGVQMALIYAQVLMVVSTGLMLYTGNIYLKYFKKARRAEAEKGICQNP